MKTLAASAVASVAASLAAAAAVLALAGPASAQNFREFIAVKAPVIALTNVKVIDGTGAPAVTNQTILIRDERIAEVGPSRSVDVPANAEVLDLTGHTVIPGLIGLHNHSFYTGGRGRIAQLSFSGSRLYLASGVTTIRTTGAVEPYTELNVARDIEAGRTIGPTMFATGPYMNGEQGSQDDVRLRGPEDARRVVRYWAEEGVTWFKAYTLVTRAELAAAIEEAHAHGVKVTAHFCAVGYREAVALGIDNVEHGLFANSEYAPGKRPDECPSGFRNSYGDLDVNGPEVQATFRDMIDNDVAMTSTLAVYEISVSERPPIDERVFDVLAPEIAEEVREISIQRREGRGSIDPAVFEKAMEYERAFVDAGGLLAAGVDPTGYGAAPPGIGDQRNYELLIEAGFSAPEVVQIMSANGAKVLGIDGYVGTVEAGKLADLVVIEGDLEAVQNMHGTKIVFRHGTGWDSAKLIDSIRGIVGIR